MPLSVLLGERSPSERWSSRDQRLAVALTELEAQLCPGCGYPTWLAHDPSQVWDVDDAPTRCFPCTGREQAAQKWMRDAGENGPEAPSALRWETRHVTGDELARLKNDDTEGVASDG